MLHVIKMLLIIERYERMSSFGNLAGNGEKTACFRASYNPGKGNEEDHEIFHSEYRRLAVCVRILVCSPAQISCKPRGHFQQLEAAMKQKIFRLRI
jgi:hypothetical protein